MANSRFYQFLYSKDAMLTRITTSFVVASNGSVSSFTGKGVQGVHARPGNTPAGAYYVELSENYNALVGFDFWLSQGTTGSNVNAGSFAVGTAYKIVTVGTTNWTTAGFYGEDFTAAVGSPFIAIAAGSGTGVAIALTGTGVAGVELLQPQSMLTNNTANEGSNFIIQCYDYAGARVAPATGSTLSIDLYLRNSTIAY